MRYGLGIAEHDQEGRVITLGIRGFLPGDGLHPQRPADAGASITGSSGRRPSAPTWWLWTGDKPVVVCRGYERRPFAHGPEER